MTLPRHETLRKQVHLFVKFRIIRDAQYYVQSLAFFKTHTLARKKTVHYNENKIVQFSKIELLIKRAQKR